MVLPSVATMMTVPLSTMPLENRLSMREEAIGRRDIPAEVDVTSDGEMIQLDDLGNA